MGVKRAVRKKPNQAIHRRVIIKQLDVTTMVDGESVFHHDELNSEAYPGRTNLESIAASLPDLGLFHPQHWWPFINKVKSRVDKAVIELCGHCGDGGVDA